MWELDYKESWVPKNWCFWTVVLEETLESPLDCKEIQPVHPKGNQSWIFTGRTDAEAETPILWPPDVKSWLIGKDPDAGKDWRWKEKGRTEDEMAGWHHRLTGHEFEWTPEVGDGGVLQSIGSQRVGHDRATELNRILWERETSIIILITDVIRYYSRQTAVFELWKQWSPKLYPGRTMKNILGKNEQGHLSKEQNHGLPLD